MGMISHYGDEMETPREVKYLPFLFFIKGGWQLQFSSRRIYLSGTDAVQTVSAFAVRDGPLQHVKE